MFFFGSATICSIFLCSCIGCVSILLSEGFFSGFPDSFLRVKTDFHLVIIGGVLIFSISSFILEAYAKYRQARRNDEIAVTIVIAPLLGQYFTSGLVGSDAIIIYVRL